MNSSKFIFEFRDRKAQRKRNSKQKHVFPRMYDHTKNVFFHFFFLSMKKKTLHFKAYNVMCYAVLCIFIASLPLFIFGSHWLCYVQNEIKKYKTTIRNEIEYVREAIIVVFQNKMKKKKERKRMCWIVNLFLLIHFVFNFILSFLAVDGDQITLTFLSSLHFVPYYAFIAHGPYENRNIYFSEFVAQWTQTEWRMKMIAHVSHWFGAWCTCECDQYFYFSFWIYHS